MFTRAFNAGEGKAITVVIILAVTTLGRGVPGQTTKQAPTVCALIVGVTKYSTGDLKGAVPAAKSFAQEVTKSFPNALVVPLYDGDASIENIRAEIFLHWPHLPPGSLVIFYFAGHGQRLHYNSAGVSSDLYLRGPGTSDDDGDTVSKSITIRDVYDGLLRTSCSTCMVFLDCCYSGQSGSESSDEQAVLNRIGARGFMLTSSATKEESVGNAFTDALIKTWESDQQARLPCLTPSQLRDSVFNSVKSAPFGDTMTPDLVFGQTYDRCIAKMGTPQTMLAFEFPHGCRYPVEFIDDATKVSKTYNPDTDMPMMWQVSVNQSFSCTAKSQGQTVWKGSFTANRFSTPFQRVAVEFADPRFALADSEKSLAAAKYTLNLARELEAYGARPAPVYFDAAALAVAANKDADVQPIIDQALRNDPDIVAYRFAASRDPEQNASIITEASPDQQKQLISSAEAVGNYSAAATGWQKVLAMQDTGNDSYVLFRAAAAEKAAGKSLADDYLSKAAEKPLSDLQKQKLALLKIASPEAVKMKYDELPTQAEWRVLGERNSEGMNQK